MIPLTDNGLQQPLQASQAERPDAALEQHLRPATAIAVTAIKEQLDRLFNWRERLSPKVRRALSAGRLLFQVVGAAGYAGYFASMHTFLRVLSGTLMAGTWYVIYRIKGTTQP
jgi:hypothetical protein